MPKQQIVLASGNAGKLREIQDMFNDSGLDFDLIPQSDFNVPEIPETGLSFVENALLKARNASEHTGLPALADDSGIAVDALDGAPGIYSARYADEGASDEDNLLKLIDVIKDLEEDDRTAQFVCLMVYVRGAGDPVPVIVEGIWQGRVIDEARGNNGFGYDPMFYVPSHDCTSAELDPETKNQLSHRGQALRKLVTKLKEI